MKTWSQIQAFITRHSLPYKVERYNMSLAGTLVDTYTGGAVAYTVKDAVKHLRGY